MSSFANVTSAAQFASRLKRYDIARQALKAQDEERQAAEERKRLARLEVMKAQGNFDHFVSGSDMHIKPPDVSDRQRGSQRPTTSSGPVSHFVPASTVLTDKCPQEKLDSRPLHEQDDAWIRMRGHRRHVTPDSAAGDRPRTAGPILRQHTQLEPRPYAQQNAQQPWLSPAAAELQSKAWMTAMKPPKEDEPRPAANTLEAWKARQRQPAPAATVLESDAPVDLDDYGAGEDAGAGNGAGNGAGGAADPIEVCTRLYPEIGRCNPAPPAAQRIETLQKLVGALDGLQSALSIRIAQVARWEIEMLQKGRSERALLGLRTMIPTLVLQFIHSVKHQGER